MGGSEVVEARVSLSLQIIHSDGTQSLLTEGFPLQMTDDGFGGNLLPVSLLLCVHMPDFRS